MTLDKEAAIRTIIPDIQAAFDRVHDSLDVIKKISKFDKVSMTKQVSELSKADKMAYYDDVLKVADVMQVEAKYLHDLIAKTTS